MWMGSLLLITILTILIPGCSARVVHFYSTRMGLVTRPGMFHSGCRLVRASARQAPGRAPGVTYSSYPRTNRSPRRPRDVPKSAI